MILTFYNDAGAAAGGDNTGSHSRSRVILDDEGE
jgi:hypothetical protein